MSARQHSAAAVELRGVGKSYGIGKDHVVRAADDVSLTVDAGACVAVTGASGSGKSTLLHLIGAMERPDAGSIRSGETDVTALRGRALADYRRTVGFVFQRYNLLPALTALDNVIAPVLPYRTRFDKRERGRELLAAVGLAGREQSLPARMSGGEQQRVAIARALMNEPALLLADEPSGNLDSANAGEILRLIGELRGRHPMTVIIATHDPQVAAYGDRMIRLRDGAVVDDIDLTTGYPAQDMIRRVGQLG
jgi:putative ABC transport system ATP-binding protein